MRIGTLRRRLSLQSEGLAPDGAGGSVASWTTVAEVWGGIAPVSSGGASAASVDRRITHVITLRARPDLGIKTGMRLVDGDSIFTIRAVADMDGRGRWLEIRAEEGGLLG